MKYYLLDFGADYADEFDVNAFKLLTEEEYIKGLEKTNKILEEFFKVENLTEQQFNKLSDYKKYLEWPTKENLNGVSLTYQEYLNNTEKWNSKLIEKTYSIEFGTNEDIQFNSIDDYYDSFVTKEITEDEYNIISKLLGKSFGVCTHFFPLNEY